MWGDFSKEAELQPHRSRYWLNANPKDPDVFRAQVGAVCDLYEPAGRLAEQGIHLVSTDEKTGIQALERLYPDIPVLAKPSQPEVVLACLLAEMHKARPGNLARLVVPT